MDIATTTDEWLRTMAAESVRHGENLRSAVRDLTLKALQGRELTLSRIKEVLRSVTQGINLGTADSEGAAEKVLGDALAGMDEALLRAAQASHIAIARLAQGSEFEDSQLKGTLDELERLEDSFFSTIRETSAGAGGKVRQQWDAVLARAQALGTGTGAEVATTLKEYGESMRDAVRESRAATFKAAHQLTQNFATLACGVLIGLSEGLSQAGTGPSAAPGRAKPAGAPERASHGKTASAASAKRKAATRPKRARKASARRASR